MMVVKKHILSTIDNLDKLYNSATTPEATYYYSKLAIIELCGWIEHSMDNIAEYFANKHLKTHNFRKIFNHTKNSTHGFDYQTNFRKMLIQTIGLHNMEKLETKVDASGGVAILEGVLTSLKTLRNNAAHTFMGVISTYQAPSVTKSQLEMVYPVLKSISKEIKNLH